tara:strand:+ start:730 stop:1239 length:510 start_codon:yes stop_codon:yes gene_type:complete
MSTFKSHKAGMFSTSVYQSSAIPYLSSSIIVPASNSVGPIKVSLPRVSKFVTIRNTVGRAGTSHAGASTTGSMRVGFASIGTVATGGLNHGADGSVAGGEGFELNAGSYGANYFVLAPGESYTGEWRVKDIFLMGDTAHQATASIIAGLTPISTGSVDFDNWTGSLGVG